MAKGGFKSGKYVFTTPTPSDAATMETTVKSIVSNVCAVIMQCEPHWTYDADLTETSGDFIKVGSGTDIPDMRFAQFLKNTSTGSKLCVMYNPGGHILHTDCTTHGSYSYSDSLDSGLCMSMIPGGSSNTWNTSSDCTTSNFVPSDGVRFISTSSYAYGNIISDTNTFTRGNYTNARYIIVVKEDLISVFSGKVGQSDFYGSFSIGKIFGQLFNADDNQYHSKYGAFAYTWRYSSRATQAETNNGDGGYDYRNFLLYNGRIPLWGASLMGNYLRADASSGHGNTFINNTCDLGICGVVPWMDTGWVITLPKTGFSPIIVGNGASNMSTYGVVPGCGAKGYLDTDFLRIVNFNQTFNTLLDNGNFIYLGGGLAHGWDPDNEIAFRT